MEGAWIKAYIDELVRFTGLDDKEDDQVDVTAYAVWQMPRMMVDSGQASGEHKEERAADAEAAGLWGRGR